MSFEITAEVLELWSYAEGEVMERLAFFGGRPRGFDCGANDGGVMGDFERTCSGVISACSATTGSPNTS